MKANMPDLTIEEKGTILLALSGWAARCDAEEKMMRVAALDSADKPERAAKCIRNAEALRKFAAEARALSDKLNGRALAEVVPAIPETLPQGFERLDGTTLRAVVDHAIYTIQCDPAAPIERRYDVSHTGGARPLHLAYFARFYAPDLAQARIVMCNGVGK